MEKQKTLDPAELDQRQRDSVRKAFGISKTVKLEDGREFAVPKWSVAKAIRMGTALANIIDRLFSVIKKRKAGEIEAALASGDDEVQVDLFMSEIIPAIPEIMSSCANDMATVMCESLTLPGGMKQIEVSQILGEDESDEKNLTIDDFADVLTEILRVNITRKTMGKWKGIIQQGMGMLSDPVH